MATATKKTTAKKTATKKQGTRTSSTAASRPRKKATKKTTQPSKRSGATASATSAPSAPQPLHEREPAALLETAGYAATGLLSDLVTLARDPERMERLEAKLSSARDRLGKDVERTLASFTRLVDARATEGRKVVDVVVKDDRVARVLDQTSATRAQVKAALTSVTRTADVASDAASKQAETARSQIKGATTSVRHSSEQARSQVKGAATSVRKIADVAYDAASKQAPNAVSQVKGAATSARKSAETIVDAATDEQPDA